MPTFWINDPIDSKLCIQDNWELNIKYSPTEIIHFINQYSVISKNIVLLTTEVYQWLISCKHVEVQLSSSGDLIGYIICIFIPTVSSFSYISTGEDQLFGYTTYLAVHPNYRKMGIAAYLIQQVMQQAKQSNCRMGYHEVPKPIHNNALQLVSYIRPVKYKICHKLGIRCPGSHDSLREKYKLYCPAGYTIRKSNFIIRSPGIYPTLTYLNQQLILHPQMDFWEISYNNQPCANFIVHRRELKFYTGNRYTIPTILIESIDHHTPVNIYQTVINQYTDVPFIYIHRSGHSTVEVCNSLYTFPTVGGRYLDWYNFDHQITLDEFHLPIV